MSINNFIEKYPKYSQFIILSTGLIILASLTAMVGFRLSQYWVDIFTLITNVMLSIFIVNEIIKLLISSDYKKHIRERWFEFIIISLLLFQLLFPATSQEFFELILPNISPAKITLIYIAILEVLMLFLLFLKFVRVTHKISKFNIHSSALLALSFLIIILVGSGMLYLPRAYHEGADYSYIDALFTSTSAVCVTGLTVVDTELHYTPLGQFFILILIQVGGLGIMTLTTFFAIFLTGGVSLKTRSIVKDLISDESIGEIQILLKKILIYTFSIEAIGVVFLYSSTVKNIFVYEPITFYHAIFHSISAFCNAGFSVYSQNLMIDTIKDNYVYTGTIMSLIVLGGLGFIVHSNLFEYFEKKRINKAFRLKIHTKIVVYSTALLIFSGMFLIYLFESYKLFPDSSFGYKLYQSLFWSISARTAGFNIMPTDAMSQASTLVIILLMWIGASPGSTGGGVKTTTLAIVLLALYNYILGRERTEIFKREISQESIRQAFFVILASLLVLGFATTLLVWMEPNKSALDLIFEVTSAHSTVGLSRNITFYIGDGAKILLTIVMFIGRVGVLAFFLSFHKPIREPEYKFPQENILVG